MRPKPMFMINLLNDAVVSFKSRKSMHDALGVSMRTLAKYVESKEPHIVDGHYLITDDPCGLFDGDPLLIYDRGKHTSVTVTINRKTEKYCIFLKIKDAANYCGLTNAAINLHRSNEFEYVNRDYKIFSYYEYITYIKPNLNWKVMAKYLST